MHPDQQAPLVLTAITLRGISSYIRGARLEVRPLTVLCGKNGSGKSTWLNALNLLRRSLDIGRLPWGFDTSEQSIDNIEVTNALYYLGAGGQADAHSHLADPDEDENYGPPGTIGLEFQAVRDIELTTPCEDDDLFWGGPQEFLWLGRCPAGTRMRLRIAHPRFVTESATTPELRDFVELQINGGPLIRAQGERDPSERYGNAQSRPQRMKPYELSCSECFLPDVSERDPEQLRVIGIASFVDLPSLRCEPRLGFSKKLGATLMKCFEGCVLQTLRLLLDGCFYIGAVRERHTYLSLQEVRVADKKNALSQRHVGAAGELAWVLERHYGNSIMRPIELARFTPDMISVPNCLRLLSADIRAQDERIARIWRLAAPEEQARLGNLSQGATDESVSAECIADLLNSVLDSRDLFADEFWMRTTSYMDSEGEVHPVRYMLDPEVEHFATRGVGNLERGDLVRLNFLLISDALEGRGDIGDGILSSWWYFLDGYISGWTRQLTDVRLAFPGFLEGMRRGKPDTLLAADELVHVKPNGYLLDIDPKQQLRKRSEKTVQRVVHPCFGAIAENVPFGAFQPPRQLSSGFHQIFPVIVQLALMKQRELICIENPEVHLHPSLQLDVGEMLVVQAAGGRHILFETHSDLLVRRVIRALLEEEISQAAVRIYFTDLEDSVKVETDNLPIRFRGSRLSLIGVDERGRIANWPSGFLEDDILESRRLMDIMYGGDSAEEDDE